MSKRGIAGKSFTVALSIFIFLVALGGIYAGAVSLTGMVVFQGDGEGVIVDSKVYEDIDSGKDTVKVIVTLKDETSVRSGLFGIMSSSVPVNVKDVAKDSRIENKVKHEFNSFNGFSAELTKEEIESLKSEGAVERISYDYLIRTFLQDSVPLINGTKSWDLQSGGLNLTGKGQTVCVIDTGIDFTHSDLEGKNLTCNIDCYGQACAEDCSFSVSDGHGTHVAGIVAANGSIKGVAPDANLIGVNVFPSEGATSSSEIIKGIEWCEQNSGTHNISVITMSLGGETLFDNYCDGDRTGERDAINAAVAKNISVTVATGNDGNSTHISSPACVQNATRVGSTDKNPEIISSFSNRWALDMLVVSGRSINSTKASGTSAGSCSDSGNYRVCSGTSMAAPHAAGAIAILRQYLDSMSLDKTTSEIFDALNSTRKRINDTEGNNLDYSRISVYESVITLDEDNPTVSLIEPSNNTKTIETNQIFKCNATDLSLSSVTFNLWNSTGIYNSTSLDISRNSYEAEFNLTSLETGDYEWNCDFEDEAGNVGAAGNNFTLSVDSLLVVLSSPADNLFTNQNQTFECNATSTKDLVNMTFHAWNSTHSLINTTANGITGMENSTAFDFNFTLEDTYKWNCLAENNESVSAFAGSNFTVTYDITPPLLNVISPLNNSWLNAERFNVSIEDANELGTCEYSLDEGATNITMSTNNNITFFHINESAFSAGDQGETYNVTFFCEDLAGNTNSSNTIFFNIDLTEPNVTLVSPANGHSVTGTTTIEFKYNVTDNLSLTGCNLILGSSVVSSNSSAVVNDSTNTINYSVSQGSYNWKIQCTDQATNLGESSSRSLIVESTSESDGASTSGETTASEDDILVSQETEEEEAGETLPTLSKIDEELTFNLNISSTTEFNVGSYDSEGNLVSTSSHSVTILNISSDHVNLTVKSDLINLTLFLGESEKLNLTNEEYYDLFLRLNSISEEEDSANITMKSIWEEMDPSESFSREMKIIIVLVVISLIFIALGVFFFLRYYKDKNAGKQNKS